MNKYETMSLEKPKFGRWLFEMGMISSKYYPRSFERIDFYSAIISDSFDDDGEVYYEARVYHENPEDWYLYARGEEKVPIFTECYHTLPEAIMALETLELK